MVYAAQISLLKSFVILSYYSVSFTMAGYVVFFFQLQMI